MGQSKIDDALKLARIRSQILEYCEGIPDLLKAHGSQAAAHMAVNLGKCLLWIGPTLDEYSMFQPLPGSTPLPRVTDLGDRIRIEGLHLLQNPTNGDLQRTIESLKRSLEFATELAKIQAEGKR